MLAVRGLSSRQRRNDETRSARLLAAAEAIGASDALALGDEDKVDAPRAGIETLRSAGLLSEPFLVPDSDGSRSRLLLEILVRIGRGSLSLGRLYEGHVNALLLVESYGTERQWSRALSLARGGELFGVWAAERPPGLRLCAEAGRRWLDGSKILASGATIVRHAIVTSRAASGRTLMVLAEPAVERADLGGWRVQGMRASLTGSVDFTGMAVDDEDIVGAEDDYTRQPAFSAGAWRFLAVQAGALDKLVEHFIAQLADAGRAEHPLQATRIAEALICAQTAKLWCVRAAEAYWRPPSPAFAVATVNLARRAVEDAALRLTAVIQRGAGLRTFMQDCPMEKIMRDLHTYLRQPNPDQAMLDAAATFVSMRPGSHDVA